MDRVDIDDEAVWILDRFYAGMRELAWPLADVAPLGPLGAVLAWVRAGARDPRCVWWSIERFGTEETLEALDEVRDGGGLVAEAAHAWAITWLRGLANEAAQFERVGPDGVEFGEWPGLRT